MGTKQLTLYHGSQNIIMSPKFGEGKAQNDYGRGFYCTKHLELAKEWACSNGEDGFANQYSLNISDLNILYLNSDKYHILNWLALLTDNRTYWQNYGISKDAKDYLKNNFLIDISSYDVIIGYRADDSYFSFAQNFVANGISLQQLKEAMYLGQLGEQVVIKSEKAFETIEYITNIPADAIIYFKEKKKRDQKAKEEYRTSVKKRPNKEDLFIIDIMREGIKNGDKRLFN